MHRSVRLVLAGLAAVGTLVLGAGGAWAADTPTFAESHAFVDRHSGALVVPYKETGFAASATTEKVTLKVTSAEASYQCFAPGAHPAAVGSPKTVTAAPPAKDVTFPVKDGASRGWAWLAATPPASGTCAAGQIPRLTAEKYTGISLIGSGKNTTDVKPDPATGGGAPLAAKKKAS